MSAAPGKKKKYHRLLWVIEPLMEEPSYLDKPMFGCLAVYLNGRLSLLLASGEEPWNGLLIPTDHQFHDSIVDEFSGVVRHPVLGKWLYLPENSEDFETTANNVVDALRMNDSRFGVEPKERKPRKSQRVKGEKT